MEESSLNKKTYSGLFWSFLNKGGSMVLSFICNIVLARLLTPEDFGIIGMVMVFVYLSAVFMDSGFGSALIQRQNTTDADFSTAFLWNLFLGVVLYVILFLTAPAIAEFYKIERLRIILRVLGLVLIINSFSLTQLSILRKNFDFKKISICFISASIIALIASIISAFNGLGVWSLVIFQLVQAFFNVVFIYFVSDWWPKLIFSLTSFKKLFNFGGFILLASIVETLNRQAQSLIIGKYFDATNLGYYNQAQNLESAPVNVVYTVIGQVSFPLFAKLQDNRHELIYKFERISSLVSFFIIPLMTLLIILAEPFIVIILSEKWLPVVPIFQILCIFGMIMPITDIAYFLIASIGKSKILFYRTILLSTTGVGLIIIGSLLGLYATVWAIVINAVLSLISFLPIIKRYLNMKIISYLKNIIGPFMICLSIYFLILILNYNLFSSLNFLAKGSVDLVLFLLLYGLINAILNTKNFKWLKYYIQVLSLKVKMKI